MADRLVKEKKTQISSVEKKYMQLLKEKGAHVSMMLKINIHMSRNM